MDPSTTKEADRNLKKELYTKIQGLPLSPLADYPFRNTSIYTTLCHSSSYRPLYDLLEKKGTFEFNVEDVPWTDTDGDTLQLRINRASKTHMWPMGTHFWVRDNALIAARLLQLNYDSFAYPTEWFQQGIDILLSTLTIMSSETQLKRFQNIIDGTSSADQALHWPHIFLSIEDNINASKDEPWMHKQDAWQIICYVTLEALEQKHISIDDLTDKNKKLLHLVCPFLKATHFYQCPNGGSWEEIEAVRTSVLAWEVALLKKITQSEHFFHSDAQLLLEKGLESLEQQIPFESPSYPKDSPQYREADASLIYLLLLDIHLLFPLEKQEEIATSLLDQILTLVGTHGVKRYLKDSYQGLSYYSNEIAQQLRTLYDSPSGDSSGVVQFIARANIVPQGHEAQWTHFLWQLSTVYGKLAKQFKNETYTLKQEDYFLFGLSLITGENEYSIGENDACAMHLIPIAPFQIPECYNTEQHEEEFFHYPSMHTPLYWSAAECLTAMNALL